MDIGMKNYIEDIVIDKMPDILPKLDVCQCDRCKMDILAYVLNQIPPKYVVTKRGKIYAKLAAIQIQFDADITVAITKAAGVVREKPRHEDEDEGEILYDISR